SYFRYHSWDDIVHRSAPGRGHAGAKVLPAIAAGAFITVAAVACSSAGNSAMTATHAASPGTPGPTSARSLGAHSLPAQTRRSLPAFPTFYDAHKDVVVVTDGFPKAAATNFHVNYAPSLSVVKPASQPAWYIVHGKAATGQLAVLGSEPGESDY